MHVALQPDPFEPLVPPRSSLLSWYRRNLVWRGSLLVAAALLAAGGGAEASTLFWPDPDVGYWRQPAPVVKRRPKPRFPVAKFDKLDKLAKQAAKPQGPLIIVVSIDQQRLKVYDANGMFAETPISTGTPGHPTPSGVFSVIQKNKYHRSNIYSGAPMPYMQRITWSGIALHAGVLPGYPASHGCIRMPMNFATRLWSWTRLGARVIITPGEITPVTFSHPLLIAQKPAPATPAPVAAALAPEASEAAGKEDIAPASITSPASEASELRPSLPPESSSAERSIARRDVRTADASNTLARPPATGTSSDVNATGKRPLAEEPVKDRAGATPGALPSTPKPPELAALSMPKRTGQIAVLISRKDGKLYVRQNFQPVFDVPVAIAPSDRPLGTHVFTATTEKEDPAAIRWSVVSLPVATKSPETRDGDERAARRRRATGAVEMASSPMPNNPAEALGRITIPADAMARIAESLSGGSSVIVSDQGIATGETGLGTDFIVPLR